MNHIKKLGGIYVLLMYLPTTSTIKIGALGTFTFEAGWYGYHGSAQKGVYHRVTRHARKAGPNKKLKWQVDYFLEYAILIEAWFAHEPREYECIWSKAMSTLAISSVPVKKMGASDCNTCPAHFYHLRQRPTAALLRNAFDTQQVYVAEFEPLKPVAKPKLEWEPDYWAGRHILERARNEYYRLDVPAPKKIANLGGNPVLNELIEGPDAKRTLKQVKFAHAVDSLIECHGTEAYEVIFDAAKPQTQKDILAISRKSWERQFDRITMVSCWDEKPIGPQEGDTAPDTMTFGKILSRIGRAKGPLRVACEILKPQLNALSESHRSSIVESLAAYQPQIKELSRQIQVMETVDVVRAKHRASNPGNKLTLGRLHVQVAGGLGFLKKTNRDIPRSS